MKFSIKDFFSKYDQIRSFLELVELQVYLLEIIPSYSYRNELDYLKFYLDCLNYCSTAFPNLFFKNFIVSK